MKESRHISCETSADGALAVTTRMRYNSNEDGENVCNSIILDTQYISGVITTFLLWLVVLLFGGEKR